MRMIVGRLGRAHGIRGEITVEVRTDAPGERFAPGAALFALPSSRARRPQGAVAEQRLVVASARDHNGTLLVGFEGVHDRSGAEGLRDLVLEADVPDRSDEDDAWYDHELVGLAVHDLGGTTVAEVVAVEHLPAQDLLVVRRPDGVRRYIPFVTALVPVVDVAGGRVVVHDPGGLLHDPDETAEA